METREEREMKNTTCTKCLTEMKWDDEIGKYVHLISGECSGRPKEATPK